LEPDDEVVFAAEVWIVLNVFTYWEKPPGSKQWPYISLCLDSIRYQCLDGCLFHHVTSENISKYIPDGVLHSSWKKIKELGVKSDCVRAACLHLYGGLYIDADTVMLRSPKHLDTGADIAASEWSTPPRRVIAGYCYCAKGSPVAERWVDQINDKLIGGNAGWCELGEISLTRAMEGCDNYERWPLETFLPIEVDTEVEKFFSTQDIKTNGSTVAIGLNHSYMTRKHPSEMAVAGDTGPRAWMKRNKSKLCIHKIFRDLDKREDTMKIGVCVATFRRPKLLGHLISCFESQTYKNARLIAYDDCGELEPASSDRWEIVSRNERHATLGEKRNAIAAMMPDVDAFVFWDDDDLFLPDALQATEHALSRSDWSRCSQVLIRSGSNLQRSETWGRQDKTDKAYQGAWGITRSAFEHAGGYDSVSLGEDLLLAKKLIAAGVSEADPVALGWTPYFLPSPHTNEHFSWNCKDYEEWNSKITPDSSRVIVQPHGIKFMPIGKKVAPRGWSEDWFKEEVR
jgi:hypothetical protein